MKTLRNFGDTMNWVEAGKRSYELRAGGEVVATLRWPKGFSSPAQGETADGRVLIERVGLLRPRLVVREDLPVPADPDAEALSQRAPLVTLDVDLGGRGAVTVRGKEPLQWVPKNVWRTSWAFEKAGTPLVSFDFDSWVPKFEQLHKVKVVAAGAEDVAPLVLVGSAVGVYITEDAALFGVF